MRIGIVGPVNPASLIDWLQDKHVPNINDSASAVNTLARGFLDEGHELWVFTLTTELPQRYRELKGERITIYLIPIGLMPRLSGFHQFVVGQFYLPHRMAKVIKKHLGEIDVLHAHWTYEYAKAASLLSNKIPVFDTVRDWCPYQLSLMKGRSRVDWLIKNITFKQVMANENITFIANSGYVHKMIAETYPEKEVPIIPNPIDKSWILNEKRKESKHQIVSIATGLCSSRKNIGKLIEAFVLYKKQYPEAKLHLVGSYDKKAENYLKWEKNGWLEGVIFHGPMVHEKIAALLDEMTFMVHPAWEETFGNIFLEAMSRCVPCIGGQDSGAVPDVLGRGKYGLTCDIHNSQSILETMVKMNENKTYKQLQADATKMLHTTYASNVVAKMHIKVFESKISFDRSL